MHKMSQRPQMMQGIKQLYTYTLPEQSCIVNKTIVHHHHHRFPSSFSKGPRKESHRVNSFFLPLFKENVLNQVLVSGADRC